MFTKSGVIIETISEQITSAGEKALPQLYKGTDDDNLDSLRYGMFCHKVASSRFHIKPEVLPPTLIFCSCKISIASGISPS